MTTYTCPVCAFTGLEFPPENFYICSCCGTEFGYDDVAYSPRELRNRWLRAGGRWFNLDDPHFTQRRSWNAWDQLDTAGMDYDEPNPFRRTHPVRIPAKSVSNVEVWAGGEGCRVS